MSVILGSAFAGFFGGEPALSILERRSDRRFQKYLMEQQRLDFETGLEDVRGLLDVEAAGQQKLLDVLQISLDTLSTAIEQTAGAQEILVEDTNLRLGDLDRLLRAVNKSLKDLLTGRLSENTRVIDVLRAKAWGATAGGALYRDEKNWHTLKGWPWSTGDTKRTHQPNPPPGWLVCDGTSRQRSNYPQLAALIGGRYGLPVVSSMFRLPAKADLTSDAVILNDSGQHYHIRI